MSKKMYFASLDSEVAYDIDYFKWLMKQENIRGMILYEAARQTGVTDFFWCNEYRDVWGKGEGICGRSCKEYAPKNGRSGCCKHYSQKFWEPTDKKILLKRGGDVFNIK